MCSIHGHQSKDGSGKFVVINAILAIKLRYPRSRSVRSYSFESISCLPPTYVPYPYFPLRTCPAASSSGFHAFFVLHVEILKSTITASTLPLDFFTNFPRMVSFAHVRSSRVQWPKDDGTNQRQTMAKVAKPQPRRAGDVGRDLLQVGSSDYPRLLGGREKRRYRRRDLVVFVVTAISARYVKYSLVDEERCRASWSSQALHGSPGQRLSFKERIAM